MTIALPQHNSLAKPIDLPLYGVGRGMFTIDAPLIRQRNGKPIAAKV